MKKSGPFHNMISIPYWYSIWFCIITVTSNTFFEDGGQLNLKIREVSTPALETHSLFKFLLNQFVFICHTVIGIRHVPG